MRLQISNPQVLINLPGDFNEGLVKTNMETLLKIAVTRVTKNGQGSYLFTLSDHLDLKKALESDGRILARTSTPLRVKEVKRKLTIQGIFDFLRYDLESQERGDQYRPNYQKTEKGDRSRSPNRDSRFVRITDAENPPDGKSKGKKGKSEGKIRAVPPQICL